jgi:hypothetical protein
MCAPTPIRKILVTLVALRLVNGPTSISKPLRRACKQ